MMGFATVGEYFAFERKRQADEMRQMRGFLRSVGVQRKEARKMIRKRWASACPKPTIADYLNMLIDKGVIIHRHDGEDSQWTIRALLVDKGQDDETAVEEAGLSWGYGNVPGQPFARKPQIRRNGHSILITQTGGLDI